MKAPVAALIAIAFVGIGWLICPRQPGVDPVLLLSRAASKCAVCPACADLIRRNYTPLVEGMDTINGKKVWALRLKPYRKHTPWRQLWIDTTTYTVLAQRDWSSQNTVRWTSRAVGVIELGKEICKRGSLPEQLNKAARVLGWRVMMPEFVPNGFELFNVEVDNKEAGIQLVYTDGLYAISVFEGREAEAAGRELRPGRVYDWGRGMVICGRAGGRRVLILADLPAADMEKIAGSLK